MTKDDHELIDVMAEAIYNSYKFVRPWQHNKTQALHGAHTRKAAKSAIFAARRLWIDRGLRGFLEG